MLTANQNRWRSITAGFCLLAVILLYAPLAGAAWSSYQMACCASGQCKIPAHHHHKIPVAPANHMDCGHDMGGIMECTMSCCPDSGNSFVASITFVLPSPMVAATVTATTSPIELAKPLDFLRSIEPLSPPPRVILLA